MKRSREDRGFRFLQQYAKRETFVSDNELKNKYNRVLVIQNSSATVSFAKKLENSRKRGLQETTRKLWNSKKRKEFFNSTLINLKTQSIHKFHEFWLSYYQQTLQELDNKTSDNTSRKKRLLSAISLVNGLSLVGMKVLLQNQEYYILLNAENSLLLKKKNNRKPSSTASSELRLLKANYYLKVVFSLLKPMFEIVPMKTLNFTPIDQVQYLLIPLKSLRSVGVGKES